MTIKLKHARQSLTATSVDSPGAYDSLVRLYAQSAKSSTPAAATLAILLGAGAIWVVPWMSLVAWIAPATAAVGLRYLLASLFLSQNFPERRAGLWRAIFAGAETLFGAAWAILVVFVQESAEPSAKALSIVIVVMASGLIGMMGSAIPIAIGCGLTPILVAVTTFFLAGNPQQAGLYAIIGAFGLAYLAALSTRLHRTALAGLSYQEENDALIAELEQARLNSDEARRRAEGANLAKSRFLATMSHELRTPLNAILGFSEVMEAELLGKHSVGTYKDYAGDIHSSGQHLLVLINEILDLSRVEAGRYELKEEAVSLTGVVEECRHLLTLRARNKSIEVTEAIEGQLPRIWADERAVRQVTLNLLSNAIKFTPQNGHIVIKVGWTQNGGQYLSVKDDGPGIPEEEIPVVLSSFGRGSMAQKAAEEGSGLGLPIVRGLVELHGGEFKLSSKVREGTEVVVIFPPERVMNALPQIDPNAPTDAQLRARRESRAERWRKRWAA